MKDDFSSGDCGKLSQHAVSSKLQPIKKNQSDQIRKDASLITRQFKCTKESFKPQETKGVRWLAPNADFYRFQQFLRTQKSDCPSMEEWLDWYENGIVFCGYMEAGNLRAFAAVIKKDQNDWELAEVQTLEAFRNRGFATATCAFIVSYALNHRSEVTYLLARESVAMEKILAKLGYAEVFAISSEQPN